MEFTVSRPDVVRSVHQLWLVNCWSRLRGTAALPLWDDLDIEELAPLADDLSFHDVVGSGNDVRFLIRFHGKRIGEAYGATCHGKFLDEILPAAYKTSALTTYRHVLATRMPVYTVADMRDRDGRIVHYERLLLPFSHDGARIHRMLVSLETVSPEGAFDNRDLMRSAARPPAFALCTTITPFAATSD